MKAKITTLAETARHPAQTMRGLSKTMCVALAVATVPSISLMSSVTAEA